MVSDCWKKTQLPKFWNFPKFLVDSEASTINPIKYLRPIFDSKFSITFIFSFLLQDTRKPRNLTKLDLNILDPFFL